MKKVLISSIVFGLMAISGSFAGFSKAFTVHYASASFSKADGLADSAWPCIGHDARHTGQSPYVGTQTDDLKWIYQTGGWVSSSAAIGADGTIYVGSDDNNVYALNPDGSLKWSFQTWGHVSSSPAIGADGTIYVGSADYNIYALNPDGRLKWIYQTEYYVNSSPAIGVDGTIYAGGIDGNIYALDPYGNPEWIYQTGSCIVSTPAIGLDGTVYVGSDDGEVYAFNPDGSLKWKYEALDSVNSSPAIGADGTIYVGSYDNNVYALNPNGSLKWKYQTGDFVGSSPAIGLDGTVYIGSDDYNVYALNPNGTLKWSCQIGGTVQSAPAIGADGTIYVGSGDKNVYALNPNGGLEWSYQTGKAVYSSPAIGTDGTIYVGSCDGKVYAFGIEDREICDEKDNDGDGEIDEGFDVGKPCTSGIGACRRIGKMVCRLDGMGTVCDANPGQPQTEVCDGQDNDCDGQIDEGVCISHSYYRDADSDGYGNPAESVKANATPAGYVPDNTDCDDTDKNVHPGASEISCNGKDDDCLNGDRGNTPGCGPITGGEKCTEADSGELDIVGVQGKTGDEVRIPIRIKSAPNEVTALGCKVTYDATVLEYSGFELGDLMKSFTIFGVNPTSPGWLMLGGMTSDEGISKGTSGYLVYLKFIVQGGQGGQEGECFPFQLEDMEDHIAHFSKTGACLCIHDCTGDLNGDGKATPLDSLIAFKCYLGSDTCFDCTDVNKDGEVTPIDAFCIFKKYLGQPSCLD